MVRVAVIEAVKLEVLALEEGFVEVVAREEVTEGGKMVGETEVVVAGEVGLHKEVAQQEGTRKSRLCHKHRQYNHPPVIDSTLKIHHFIN